MREREQQQEPYWQHDELLGEAPIRGERTSIRVGIHIAEERYHERHELVPLTHPRGTRTYVHARPYILEPEISLTLGLYPSRRTDGAIGEVLSSEWEGMRHVVIGNAQAWLYQEDRTLMVWECFLNDRWRQPDPVQDEALKTLWSGFERLLLERLPSVARIVVPNWEPIYEGQKERWQAFLRAQGYGPLNERAFAKEVTPSSGSITMIEHTAPRPRVIVAGRWAYFLYPSAPEGIADRAQLLRWSGHRTPTDEFTDSERYQVHQRPDLAT